MGRTAADPSFNSKLDYAKFDYLSRFGFLPVFLSETRFEHHVPPALLPPGARGWRVVELSLHVPWFIVTMRDHPDDCSRELMVAYEADLVDLVTQAKAQIRAIHRVVPASLNRAQWGIEPLHEVRVVTSTSSPSTRWWEFVGTCGTEISWPKTKLPQDMSLQRELIWSGGIH